MKIKSQGFLTDLMFHQERAEIEKHEDYMVIKTPDNPYYFWGNFIFLYNPPRVESIDIFESLFEEKFSSMPIEHIAFTWDYSEKNDQFYNNFQKIGYEIEKTKVLIADYLDVPRKCNQEIQIKQIETADEWNLVFENQIQCRESHFSEDSYRQFLEPKFLNYKKMIDDKKGYWFGAFLNNLLVADLGLFFENQVARYQAVETLPQYRSKGICSTLLYRSSLILLDKVEIKTFVITAAFDYHAARIYQSLGFKESEILVGICKFNKTKWSTQS